MMIVKARKYAQKRKPRTKKDEFLWLISLSDLMILLFIFFVVLFAFTYQRVNDADFLRVLSLITEGEQGVTDIEKIRGDLTAWVADEKLMDQVAIQRSGDALEVEIKDNVLFASGEYEPHAQGIKSLRLLSQVLDKVPYPYRIGIEGHTDDTPMRTRKIRDNWDLSARRSLSVLWAFDLSEETLKRTVIQAYGETRPVVPNRDESGRAIAQNQKLNRRVTIRIF